MHSLSSKRQFSCVPLGLRNFCFVAKKIIFVTNTLYSRFRHLELNFAKKSGPDMDLICMIDVEIDGTSSNPRKESVQKFYVHSERLCHFGV